MKRQRRLIRRPRMAPAHCSYCEAKIEPEPTDTASLSRQVSERAMIVPRSSSGLCSKHQKALTKAIKHARFLGLLPYIARA